VTGSSPLLVTGLALLLVKGLALLLVMGWAQKRVMGSTLLLVTGSALLLVTGLALLLVTGLALLLVTTPKQQVMVKEFEQLKGLAVRVMGLLSAAVVESVEWPPVCGIGIGEQWVECHCSRTGC
jgi:hypothetical protein